MSRDDDELRINTLHRFEKRSPKYVLRVYDSCEVPAGCGGVVLRWVNPADGMSVIVHVVTPFRAEAFFDGVPFRNERLVLPIGEHVLALRLTPSTENAASPPFLACAVIPDTPDREPQPPLFTTGDGSDWRVNTSAPDGWPEGTFSDTKWERMRTTALRADTLPNELRWRYPSLERVGAQALAVPSGSTLYVRHRFVVPASR